MLAVVLAMVLKMREWLGQLAQLDAQSFSRNVGGLRNDRIGRQDHALHEPHHWGNLRQMLLSMTLPLAR